MLEFTYYNTEKIDNLKDFFNRIKRILDKVILDIQKYLSNLPIFKYYDTRIIDSIPISVCKINDLLFF